MIIGFIKEQPDWEYRVALVPSSVPQLIKAGHQVIFEKNAGQQAGYDDEEYLKVGARQYPRAADVYKKAEFIAKIWAPRPSEYSLLKARQWIAADFESFKYPEQLKIWKKHQINALALERLPRLSRVQDLDILSSQNNLAGYKAALIAMNMQNQSVPLMMTSSGTLAPLKALVLGVGVAGLQAIATLHRMGATVFASDIRPETAEQVVSLGAKFIENTPENIEKQLLISNILITTALSLQGTPPLLISAQQLQKMPPGSIAIDLTGGNIEGAVRQTVTEIGNVKLLSDEHLAATLAHSSSFLYSRNILNLVLRWPELNHDPEIWSAIHLGAIQPTSDHLQKEK